MKRLDQTLPWQRYGNQDTATPHHCVTPQVVVLLVGSVQYTYCVQSLLHIILCPLVGLTEVLQVGHGSAQRGLQLCTSQPQFLQVMLYPCSTVVITKLNGLCSKQSLWLQETHTTSYFKSRARPLEPIRGCVSVKAVNSCGCYLLPPTNQTSFSNYLGMSGLVSCSRAKERQFGPSPEGTQLCTFNNAFHNL